MEQSLKNSYLSFLNQNAVPKYFKKQFGDSGHIDGFQAYGKEIGCVYSAVSHDGMGMALAKMGVATILDGKAYHIIMLPEQLSKEQIEYFYDNKEFFDNLNHRIRTMVYCKQKTDYGDRYRKLHKEAMINGIDDEIGSILLFNEIDNHLQNLSLKKR